MAKENLKTYLDVDNGETKASPDEILNLKEFRGLIVPPIIDYKKTVAKFRRRDFDCPCCAVAGCAGYNCFACIFSHRNSLARLAYINELEAALKEKENETMEENKTIEEFLRPGVLFKTESGEWYINIRGYYAYNVTLDERGDWCIKGMYTNIVRPKDVIEAYDVGETAAGASENMPLLVSDIGIIIKGLNLPCHIKTWKRPTPIKELTMSDLEKHFGCKVKVVKDN